MCSDATDNDCLQMIAITALYLAGKVEEQHMRLTDVINVSYRLCHFISWLFQFIDYLRG